MLSTDQVNPNPAAIFTLKYEIQMGLLANFLKLWSVIYKHKFAEAHSLNHSTNARKTMKNSDSGCCFTRILRLLLCQGGTQQRTHPSSSYQIPEAAQKLKLEEASGPAAHPGVVAKLMGLDSLPDAKWVPKGRAPESVTRSRSVNFMEYLLDFNVAAEQAKAHHRQHRRVTTSVSFREVPALLNREDEQSHRHELFLFSFDDQEDKKKMKLKSKGKGDLKLDLNQKKKKEDKMKNQKVCKFIDEPSPKRVSIKRSPNRIKNCSGNKEASPKMNKKKMSPLKPMHKEKISRRSKNQLVIEEAKPPDHHCSSENLSPISVLDANDFTFFDANPFSDERGCMDLHSKMKASSSSSSARALRFDDLDQQRVMKQKDKETITDDQIQFTEFYSELVAKLHKLTEEAIMQQSNWVSENLLNSQQLEQMCMEFGQHILELLLQQLTQDLLGF